MLVTKTIDTSGDTIRIATARDVAHIMGSTLLRRQPFLGDRTLLFSTGFDTLSLPTVESTSVPAQQFILADVCSGMLDFARL